MGVMQGRKAYQLPKVLFGFEISLLCLSRCNSNGEWGWKEGERYCDRGRECAIEKKALVRRMVRLL